MKRKLKKILIVLLICIMVIQPCATIKAKSNWKKKIDYSYLKKVLYYLPEYDSINKIGKRELGGIINNISWYKHQDYLSFPSVISDKYIIKKNVRDSKTYNQNLLVKKNTFDKLLNVMGYKGKIEGIIKLDPMHRLKKDGILIFIGDRGSGSKGYVKIYKKMIKKSSIYLKYKRVNYWPDEGRHVENYTAKIVKGGKLGYKIKKIY